MNRSPLIIHRWFPHPVNADWAYGPGLVKGDFERCVRAIESKYKGAFGKVGPLIVPGEPTLILVGERIDDRREVETRGKPMLRLAVLRELPGWEAWASIASALEAKDAEGPGEQASLEIAWGGETTPIHFAESEPPGPEVVQADRRPRSRLGVLPTVLSGVACLILGGMLGAALTGQPATRPPASTQAANKPEPDHGPASKPANPAPPSPSNEPKERVVASDAPAILQAPTAGPPPTPAPVPTIPATPSPSLNLTDPAIVGVRSLARVQGLDELLEKADQYAAARASKGGELSEAYLKARDSVGLAEIHNIKESGSPPEEAISRFDDLRIRLKLAPSDPLQEAIDRTRDGLALEAIGGLANGKPEAAIAGFEDLRKRLGLAKGQPLEDFLIKTRDGLASRKILAEANRIPDQAIEGLKKIRAILTPENGFLKGNALEDLATRELIRAYLRAFESAHEVAVSHRYDGLSIQQLATLAGQYEKDGIRARSNALYDYASLVAERTKGGNLEQTMILSAISDENMALTGLKFSFPREDAQAASFSGTNAARNALGMPSWKFKIPIFPLETSILQLAIRVASNDPGVPANAIYRSKPDLWPAGRTEIDLELFGDGFKGVKVMTLKREGLPLPEPPNSIKLFPPSQAAH